MHSRLSPGILIHPLIMSIPAGKLLLFIPLLLSLYANGVWSYNDDESDIESVISPDDVAKSINVSEKLLKRVAS